MAPVLASIFFTAIDLSGKAARAQTAAGIADVSIGALCVAATGGILSPFSLYLTVAPIAVSARQHLAPTVIVTTIALVGLLGAGLLTTSDPAAIAPVLDEAAAILLFPTLVFVLGNHAIPRRMARPRLATQDVELLRDLAEHLTYKEIAARRGTSPENVKVIVSRTYRRLGAQSRAEAVAIAQDLDLLQDHPH